MINDSGIFGISRLADINLFAKRMYYSNPLNPNKYFMDINDQDVRQFLKALSDYKVRYMLVGGLATVFHGHVRTTQDLDLWIEDKPENKSRLIEALKSLEVSGAENYKNVDMIPGWSTITIGDKGLVADIMGYLHHFKKHEFDECYKRSIRTTYEGIPLVVISKKDLISEKKSIGRYKDLDDVENLTKPHED